MGGTPAYNQVNPNSEWLPVVSRSTAVYTVPTPNSEWFAAPPRPIPPLPPPRRQLPGADAGCRLHRRHRPRRCGDGNTHARGDGIMHRVR